MNDWNGAGLPPPADTDESMASLVTLSGVTIPLESNCAYILGRASGCHIRIDDIASSRRHAELSVGRSGKPLHIEDLGSRNGTFVNEIRIDGRRRLRDGSVIRIGATTYTVALHRPSPLSGEPGDSMEDTGTVGMERLSLSSEIGAEVMRALRVEGPSLTDFAGKLEIFGLVDVLQLLIHNQRSGTLHPAVDSGHGQVDLRGGEVLAAAFQNTIGLEALVRLAKERSGMFWLVEKTTDCTDQIGISQAMLLIELCRSLDEANAV